MNGLSHQLAKLQPLLRWIDAAVERLHAAMSTRWARWLVLGLFVAQATLLAFVTYIGTPPDETNHINFIEYYAHHSVGPVFTHQTPTYSLGDKTRELDYLYHYTMSLLYRVLPLGVHEKYIAIRLCSVGLALLSFIILAKILKRLGVSAAAITVGLLVLTNLPMVLMMSAAINNDTSVWLGAVLGVWLLLRLWDKPSLYDFLWLVVLALLSGLVKRTLMPLGLLFVILGFVVVLRNLKPLLAQLLRFDWRLIVVGVVLIISSGLFLERVGGNLLRYHALTPSCEQVQGVKPCSVFWVNVRKQNLPRLSQDKLIPLPLYVVTWLTLSLYNIIDIQTQFWLHQVSPAWWLMPILSLVFLAGLAYGIWYEWRHWREPETERRSRWRIYVMGIGIYFLLVQFAYNYVTYTTERSFGLALNGRYIIPSVLLLAGFSSFYLVQLLRTHRRLLTLLAIVVFLGTIIGSGLTMMLRNPQLYYPINPAEKSLRG